MTESDKEEIVLRAATARGRVISSCCLLEKKLDVLLAKYFAKGDNAYNLIQLLFSTDKINLKNKYRLLIDILNLKYSAKVVEVLFPIIQKKFDFFTEFRNRFAHDAELRPPAGLSGAFYSRYSICLVYLSKVNKSVFYTDNDISDLIHYVEHLEDVLDKISSLIIGTQQPTSNSDSI